MVDTIVNSVLVVGEVEVVVDSVLDDVLVLPVLIDEVD